MNSKKLIKNYLLILLLAFNFNVFAEEQPYRVVEIESSKIKLAQDGTGIVKGIKCTGCDFSFVKITASSKASIQGLEVNILQARNIQPGTVLMVSFNPVTQEVQYIRW